CFLISLLVRGGWSADAPEGVGGVLGELVVGVEPQVPPGVGYGVAHAAGSAGRVALGLGDLLVPRRDGVPARVQGRDEALPQFGLELVAGDGFEERVHADVLRVQFVAME